MPRKYKAFVRSLREGMQAAGISARQLALEVGVHPSYIARMLRGERNPPSNGIIERMARFLDLDPRHLLIDAGRLPGFTRTTRPPTDEDLEAFKQFWDKRLKRKKRT